MLQIITLYLHLNEDALILFFSIQTHQVVSMLMEEIIDGWNRNYRVKFWAKRENPLHPLVFLTVAS